LQIAKSNPDLKILYCAGEESAGQIKQRAKRLGVTSDKLLVYNETQINKIIDEVQKIEPDLLIVDSIQTVYRTELQSMPGSIQQVKECAALFQQLAKKKNITTIVIGHVTKEGDIAGPRVLEHMVDTVLQFEGDKNYTYRLLRSLKNRFGPAQEVGVFEMKEDGLIEVSNPSELFISDKTEGVSGNAIVCTMEGSRPLLIEVQALVTASAYGTPQRTSNGFDRNRLALLLAVLEKRAGYSFYWRSWIRWRSSNSSSHRTKKKRSSKTGIPKLSCSSRERLRRNQVRKRSHKKSP
jgi:DNA repair protein RadA/Sms